MRSESTMTTSAPRLTVLAFYWAAGFMLAGTYLQEDLFPIQVFSPDWRWICLLLASLAVVGFDVYVYHRCCLSKDRPLDGLTLIVFPTVNGLAETAIFLSVFKVGETFAAQRTENQWWSFVGGMVPFFAYATLIHVFMWMRILPDHLDDSSGARFYRRLLVPSKVLLATSWAALYFAYRDAWSVVALHVLVDVGLVVFVRYSL